jgi:hypothetical protein
MSLHVTSKLLRHVIVCASSPSCASCPFSPFCSFSRSASRGLGNSRQKYCIIVFCIQFCAMYAPVQNRQRQAAPTLPPRRSSTARASSMDLMPPLPGPGAAACLPGAWDGSVIQAGITLPRPRPLYSRWWVGWVVNIAAAAAGFSLHEGCD